MVQFYVTDNRAHIGIKDGRVEVHHTDGLLRSVPLESVEGITIIGNAQITTGCVSECLKKGIPIQYYSTKGFYFGKTSSTQHVSTKRQRLQIKLTENEEFSLEIAKIILEAKVNNQVVLLRRYRRSSEENVEEQVRHMKILSQKISQAKSLEEVCGYEGNSARSYFKALNILINNSEFEFKGRTRQPPKDEFNSMLSLGYSILMNDVYGALEGRGLNPYFGFIHQDREKHPTLASDMVEEWRAVIVDSVVMSLVNGNEISAQHFYKDDETQGVFLKKDGLKIFISKLEKRFNTSMKYLEYLDYSVSFRRATDLQALQLCKAIEEGDPKLYKPIIIR